MTSTEDVKDILWAIDNFLSLVSTLVWNANDYKQIKHQNYSSNLDSDVERMVNMLNLWDKKTWEGPKRSHRDIDESY